MFGVRYLIEQNDVLDDDSTLHFACSHGAVSVAEMQITHFHADVNELNSVGWCPLRSAMQSRSQPLFDMLVSHGANVNFTTDGISSLLLAALYNLDFAFDTMLRSNPPSRALGATLDILLKPEVCLLDDEDRKAYIQKVLMHQADLYTTFTSSADLRYRIQVYVLLLGCVSQRNAAKPSIKMLPIDIIKRILQASSRFYPVILGC